VEQRLLDAVDPVFEHAAALERERGQRQAAFVVLARLQAVAALLGEEAGPQAPLAGIDGVRVGGVEPREFEVGVGVELHHASITSRQ
jgi:hypothetical protein